MAQALLRRTRRFFIKTGNEVRALNAGATAPQELLRALIHEDGFLRIPVLVVDDTLVRGWNEDAYRAALGLQ